MKSKHIASVVLAFGLSALTVNAFSVSGVVSCPNGISTAFITVFVPGIGQTRTALNGAFFIPLPDTPATYRVCVDIETLPVETGLVGTNCATFSVSSNAPNATVNFTTLAGDLCVLPEGCWLTGGGTIKEVQGQPAHFTFGGVVNPGCNPAAPGGGNWHVIDHTTGLHFQTTEIRVVFCTPVAPGEQVNFIRFDFTGTGILSGIGGNPSATIPVCFLAHTVVRGEPGVQKGPHLPKDFLYLNVYDCVNPNAPLLLIGNPLFPTLPFGVLISTGNLQVHTTGCGK